jgi:hypothetical protein
VTLYAHCHQPGDPLQHRDTLRTEAFAPKIFFLVDRVAEIAAKKLCDALVKEPETPD